MPGFGDFESSRLGRATHALPQPSEPLTYEVQYVPEIGEVHSYWHSKLEEIIRVRLELKEKLLREVVVVELERLGYTVIPPQEPS